MQSNHKHSLGKKERLKSRKLIEQLFKDGKSFNLFPYKIVYRSERGDGALQAGFSVSSRIFKKAVDRNRIKRQTREAYRLQKKILAGHLKEKQIQLFVFLVYTSKELQDYKVISQSIGKILDKIIRMINESNFSNS